MEDRKRGIEKKREVSRGVSGLGLIVVAGNIVMLRKDCYLCYSQS